MRIVIKALVIKRNAIFLNVFLLVVFLSKYK